MSITSKTAFSYTFFKHFYDYRKEGQKKVALRILMVLFRSRLFLLLLWIFERLLGFLMGLPIPLYSDLMLMLVSALPGTPRMLGCYLRAIYFRPKLKYMGQNVVIDRGVTFSYPKQIELHEFCMIDKNVIIAADSVVIGRRTHLAPNVIVTGGGDLVIDDFVGIASGCRLITSTESLKPGTLASGPLVPQARRDVLRGKIHIKNNAFLAAGVSVLPDTVIEEGCVLSAHTVCPQHTEPWSVYMNSDSSGLPVRAHASLPRGHIQPRAENDHTGIRIVEKRDTIPYLAEAAKLHVSGIEEGFLSSLGPGLLSILYDGIAFNRNSGMLIAVSSNMRCVGFLSYTRNISRMYPQVIGKLALPLGCMLFPHLLKPVVYKKMWNTISYPFRSKPKAEANAEADSAPPCKAELLSMAVDPAYQGMGIGKKLIAEMEERLKQADGRAYRVVTSARDVRSNHFYQSCGCELNHSFQHHGKPMNEYRKSINPETP